MRGYIRKRGKTYSYTVDVGRHPDTGKRMQKSKGGFKTKKAAQEALNSLVYEVNNGSYIVNQDSTFEEYAAEWFKNIKHRLRPTTAEQYEKKIKKTISKFCYYNSIIFIIMGLKNERVFHDKNSID